jgi:hypothetical protein
MSLIRPFRGLRPAPGQAGAVAAPPYDVLSSDEARSIVHGSAAGKPWSFLHISKPEIDLPREIDIYSPEVYAKAAENLQKMLAAGILARDAAPCYYAYRLTMGGHVQTGLVAAASGRRLRQQPHSQARIHAPRQGRRPRAPDRGAQCADRPGAAGLSRVGTADDLIAAIAQGTPAADVTPMTASATDLGDRRRCATIAAITEVFDAMPSALHRRRPPPLGGRLARRGRAARTESAKPFLAVIFPHHQMKILDYNRVVSDLHGLEKSALVARVGERFTVEDGPGPRASGAARRIRHVPAGPLVQAEHQTRT